MLQIDTNRIIRILFMFRIFWSRPLQWRLWRETWRRRSDRCIIGSQGGKRASEHLCSLMMSHVYNFMYCNCMILCVYLSQIDRTGMHDFLDGDWQPNPSMSLCVFRLLLSISLLASLSVRLLCSDMPMHVYAPFLQDVAT